MKVRVGILILGWGFDKLSLQESPVPEVVEGPE